MKRCLFCLTPLANGSATCSATCEAGWLRLMPPVSVYRDPERVQRDPRPERGQEAKAAWGARMVNARRQQAARARLGL